MPAGSLAVASLCSYSRHISGMLIVFVRDKAAGSNRAVSALCLDTCTRWPSSDCMQKVALCAMVVYRIPTNSCLLSTYIDLYIHTCLRRHTHQIRNCSLTVCVVVLLRASILLKILPSLGDVRYRLVPAKISEEEFWSRFFSAVRRRVQQHVSLSAAQKSS